jgi:DNA (cytosine-5)-methyltransferase 1
MNRRYTCIDSFCGAGGLALGLRRAGFEILVSFDANECAVPTFRRNLLDRCLHARAEDLSGGKLLTEANFDGRLDLFAGGPPCQGFSKQKRGSHLGDERNGLVFEFARLVREACPRFSCLKMLINSGKNAARTS